jgi:hypothetical protein
MEIVCYICWIPHRNCFIYVGFCAETLIFLFECVQKFYSSSSAFHTEFLFDTCWIRHRNSVRYLLDSAQKFCSTSVGFHTQILFYICRILPRSFVSYLLDSAQKFYLISIGLRTEILLDACCISHKFCCISAGFRTELVFRKTTNVCRSSQYLLSVTGTEDLAVVQLGSRSPLQAICTCILAAGGNSSLWT